MSLAACAAIVERGDPDRFLAAMSCPPPAREVLFPLYAFNVEVSRAPYVTDEPMIAEMRLQWWRDAVEEIDAGKAPRAHEVAAPLAGVMRAHDLPAALLDEAVAARRWDVWKEPFEDAAAFEAHIQRTAGHLAWLSALGLGAGAAEEAGVREVAHAGGVAAWLQAVPALEAKGLQPLVAGRPDDVRALAGAALARLKAARVRSEAARLAVRPAWQAGTLLRLAVREPERVARGALALSEFRRKALLGWRAARRG
ncbi:Probable Phytoene/squalene synthetase [Oceanicola granulosus HTCC2516]|uniref:Probable Phytoene/squalene synthetase n=1 Tax=Oceanicola granulosus (strain ATCC BAA-861 / DSM 15982 / KCTC 12143 / HTCC2516) TaxID=314256 RepID=Q2CD27_OCEGH|nr:squalene/phytoene synthase family protein [Oceanicola granulosus]EAR50549.1 Probable Phytoene/squalene synthetase [Oceanicola granulosus HTCC2516]